MISFIIWLVGVVLTVKAAMEIWKIEAETTKKVVVIILMLLTSWLGLAFYYLYGKDRMAGWLK